MKKILAVFLILIQASCLPAAYLGEGKTPASRPLSVEQVSGMTSVLATVKTGLAHQMKMLVELASLASSLRTESTPAPEPQKVPVPQPAMSAASVITFDGSRYEKPAPGTNSGYAAHRETQDTRMLFALLLLLCFFIIDRVKIRQYFYLLPRGSIDDAFISIQGICSLYALIDAARNEGFLFVGGRNI